MTSRKFHALLGGPPRDPDAPLTQHHMDLAASIQKVTEEIISRITRNLAATYKIENLCLAGGVALNCVSNGKLCAMERLSVSEFSRQQVMLVGLWARHSLPIISTLADRAN